MIERERRHKVDGEPASEVRPADVARIEVHFRPPVDGDDTGAIAD